MYPLGDINCLLAMMIPTELTTFIAQAPTSETDDVLFSAVAMDDSTTTSLNSNAHRHKHVPSKRLDLRRQNDGVPHLRLHEKSPTARVREKRQGFPSVASSSRFTSLSHRARERGDLSGNHSLFPTLFTDSLPIPRLFMNVVFQTSRSKLD